MSARPSLDRNSFETLLANAYAVQTSGLDTRSLSALIEIQRFVTSDSFQIDRAMLMLAEGALQVASASGVAVALLEPSELVYRAGSGSAANDLGRRVPAVLSVSSRGEGRREILKVENAHTDSRIEAEVCRQFGVNSILMLPIYKDHALFGVLQVQFDEAHCFLEREIRAYRLMLRALEEGIVRHLQPSPQKSAASITAKQLAHDSGRPRSRELQPADTATSSIVVAPVGEQKQKKWSTDYSKEQRWKRDHRVGIRRALQKLYPALRNEIDRLGKADLWQVATAVAVSVMLAIAIWTVYGDRPAASTNGPALSAGRDSGPQLPAKVLLAGMKEEQLGNGAKATTARVSAFKRVRIGPNEVDYVAEDVTIKTFATPSINHDLKNEVRFGDDVTVRYFVPSSVPVSSPQNPQ